MPLRTVGQGVFTSGYRKSAPASEPGGAAYPCGVPWPETFQAPLPSGGYLGLESPLSPSPWSLAWPTARAVAPLGHAGSCLKLSADMRTWDTVAIVGVGLIGGSIGRALLARQAARRVVGIGRRAASLRIARRMGAATETTTSLARGVEQAELIVVCTSVADVVRHVREVAQSCPAGALVTDAGSTKGAIVAALDGTLPRSVRFVGSHPLAGSERRGPSEADSELFVDRLVVLTPSSQTRPIDVRRVAALWRRMGAATSVMGPEDHDRALALTSHLPHVVAAALAAVTPPDLLTLTAGGWRDTTRVAGGDPALWEQIFLSNREQVLAALGKYQTELDALSKAIRAGDGPTLRRRLSTAQLRRLAWRPPRKRS